MHRLMGLVVAGGMILAGISGALAFSAQPSNPAMDRAIGNRLADPEDLADQMSGPPTGGDATVMHFGGMTTQFSTPRQSPFLDDGSAAGFRPVPADR
jgi:hypothetical protein